MNQKKVIEINSLASMLELDDTPIPNNHPINQYEKMIDEQQLAIDIPKEQFQSFQKELIDEIKELKVQVKKERKAKKAYHFYFEIDLYNELSNLAIELDRSNTSLLAEAVKDLLIKHKKGTN